eukprot:5360116-Prorocentrum_lima.AAC.1
MTSSLVGSEMCIRDREWRAYWIDGCHSWTGRGEAVLGRDGERGGRHRTAVRSGAVGNVDGGESGDVGRGGSCGFICICQCSG